MLRENLVFRSGAVALGVFMIVLAGGCGSASGPETGEGERLDKPVTVKHRFGSTKVDKVPKRVVTIDVQWTDTMLAMGVEPVGYTTDSLMPKSRVPWQQAPKGATALSLEDGVPVEKIIALKPDLIVGSFSISDKQTYEQLSARAPTIAGPPESDEVIPWQELVSTAGDLLDEPERAKRVVDRAEGEIDRTGKEFPQLKGQTFALAQYIVGDAMTVVADEKDGSSLLFQRLGMKMFAPVRKEGEKTGKTRVNVSTERADLLRADLLCFLINGGDRSDLTDIPGFDRLPGTVAVLDYATVVGMNTPTPLSIPHVLEKLRPHLKGAARS